MHTKFQRNRPSNCRVIVIMKLTPLRFARGTCIRGHPHASTIVQYLVGAMELLYKKDCKWIGPVVAKLWAGEMRRHGRPLILSFVCYSTKDFARSEWICWEKWGKKDRKLVLKSSWKRHSWCCYVTFHLLQFTITAQLAYHRLHVILICESCCLLHCAIEIGEDWVIWPMVCKVADPLVRHLKL